MSLEAMIENMARAARKAARQLRSTDTARKDKALIRLSESIIQRQDKILRENAEDVTAARDAGLSPAMLDRLALNPARLKEMADAVREVALLQDPVGSVTGMWKRPNGLMVGRMRIPLGVIGFIYESRPNVTTDAAALCLKSGNTVILKGGSEAQRSNMALEAVCSEALAYAGISRDAIQVVPTTRREAVGILIALSDYLDVVIPRGGEELIRFVTQNAKVPVLKHYKGVCHIFVDESAETTLAQEVCFNAKVQRPGVCNAMETLLVHEGISGEFLLPMLQRFRKAGVEIRGCPKTLEIFPEAVPAVESDWPAEFLDLILAVRVVKDMDEALEHIERYGSRHTEAIITSDYNRSQRFLAEVDSSVVLVNASTRFNDGNQLGLGAEIGINTSKLHAFGPMGPKELTATKFIVFGQGQIRT